MSMSPASDHFTVQCRWKPPPGLGGGRMSFRGADGRGIVAVLTLSGSVWLGCTFSLDGQPAFQARPGRWDDVAAQVDAALTAAGVRCE
jgi:hypothetical protein